MPIDAVFLESLRCELQEQLLACRVDKVQQPERDTIRSFHARTQRRRKAAADGYRPTIRASN